MVVENDAFYACQRLKDMKFRRLTEEELEILKDDFIKFLASNTVTASDWVNIKENKQEEAHELIEMFSDIVMEKVYSKVNLLETREKNSLLVFKFDGDLMTILGINTADTSVDFANAQLDQIDFSTITITGFRTSKVLEKGQKEVEVHQLIEAGSLVGNEQLFKILDQIIE